MLGVGRANFKAPQGQVDVETDSITTTAKVSGFKVEYRTVFFDGGTAAVLVSFKNPTVKAKTARVRIGTGFDSPSLGPKEGGDPTLTANDSWFEVVPTTGAIPTMTLARGDCDTLATGCAHGDIVARPTGPSTDWIEAYKFSVKPKKTKRLLFYIQMSKGPPASPSDFDTLASLGTANLLDPFTSAEKAQIVNWQH